MDKFKSFESNDQLGNRKDTQEKKKYVYRKPKQEPKQDLQELDQLLDNSGVEDRKNEIRDTIKEVLNSNYWKDEIWEMIWQILNSEWWKKRQQIWEIIWEVLKNQEWDENKKETIQDVLKDLLQKDNNQELVEERREKMNKVLDNLDNLVPDLQVALDEKWIDVNLIDIVSSLRDLYNYPDWYGFEYKWLNKLEDMFSNDITDLSSFSDENLFKMYLFLKWINIIHELWKNSIKWVSFESNKFNMIEWKIKNEIFKRQLKDKWLYSEFNKLTNIDGEWTLDVLENN